MFFKREPIKWRIIEESDETALLLCNDIIDMQDFGEDNNFLTSNIRAWLNGDFLDNAFTNEEREIILTSRLDNGIESTGFETNPFACEDTNDLVFLLSYKEAFETFRLSDEDRIKRSTQYAFFKSANDSDEEWWLRSPDNENEFCVRIVNGEGKGELWNGKKYQACVQNAHIYEEIDYVPYTGVVPALRIYLKDKDSV